MRRGTRTVEEGLPDTSTTWTWSFPEDTHKLNLKTRVWAGCPRHEPPIYHRGDPNYIPVLRTGFDKLVQPLVRYSLDLGRGLPTLENQPMKP